MADVFISYSSRDGTITSDFASILESEGYTTWWDTSLLPDDDFFPDTIKNEIDSAKAVVVIWSEHSARSRWVYSEANRAQAQRKLIQIR